MTTTTTTTMADREQQEQGESSHEEEMNDDNHNHNHNHRRKRMVVESSSSSPSNNTSFNDELHKNEDENKIDDGDEISENINKKNTNVIKQVPIITAEEKPQVKHILPEKDQGEELESAKAEMGQVMEENQRLKQYLNKIIKDYELLQQKFHEISQKDSNHQPKDNQMTISPLEASRDAVNDDDDDDEAQLVSLSLGRSQSLDSKKNNIKLSKINNTNNVDDEEAKEKSLDLKLEYKYKVKDVEQNLNSLSSPNNSFDDEIMKDGENGAKILKNNNNNGGEDEVAQQPSMKKARVSVRVRCDTPTMNDGCQWRKYGQKIAKGNPCPRAYYRCTVAPACPVRKQVQRCADDMSILITTYEGTHNHPLPISASAMASTTSAAAYMLMSKSSTSSNPPGYQPTPTIATSHLGNDLYGGALNFNILDDSKPKPNYNSSTFALTPSHPTITLDLTSTSSPSTNQLNRITPNMGLSRADHIGPGPGPSPGPYNSSSYSSTNFTFNFSHNSNNPILHSWPNSLPSYGNPSYINKNQASSLNIIGSSSTQPTSQNIQTNILQKSISPNPLNHDSLPDTIVQAAKVLTSDPSFQSILTATLSSFINGNNGISNNRNVGNNVINSTILGDSIKWGGLHTNTSSSTSSFPSTSKETNGCASTAEPTGSLMFLNPPLSLSTSKSKSTSPDNKKHTP